MYEDRVKLYKKISKLRNSYVITYVTSTRTNMELDISKDIINFFPDHLDNITKKTKRISLILHTNGGDILAGWTIVNLIRMYCDYLEVIIPSRALSTGTLISLGADNIVMTKQAILGPIDPSVTTSYNQKEDNKLLPISVEDLDAYFKLAKEVIGDDVNNNDIFLNFSRVVHPLAIGKVKKTKDQIRMLATRLLKIHTSNDETIERITNFLCSDSGSHDYTINRKEAKNLGLPIEFPDENLYNIIKLLYNDFCSELMLSTPFYSDIESNTNTSDSFIRIKGILETIETGSDKYIYSGKSTLCNGIKNEIIEKMFWERT
ncbi:MAG: ATP-dependent Clp protease proteolytic subunit [Bilophila sp.]|uniref:SDH family Clp fold serine proteinase n=1 Tax=Bilophila sp. TaxID=1929485 RepID=UPI00257D975B|nr:ATP-dependent Clp protease proteolytic subunit [Bilophila sp.]MBS5455595.1 ATP-dependent Clp protease proteolytic subunit [Bilophila sp.]